MVKDKITEKSENTTNVIGKIIRKLFSESATDIAKITKGEVNKVFEIRTPKRNLIIRMNRRSYLDEYQKERQCMEKAKTLGIPTPTVINIGFQNSYVYMVYESIPGILAGEYLGNKLRVWSQLGKYSALINSTKTYGYGGRFQFEPNPKQNTNSLEGWVRYIERGIDMVLKPALLIKNGVIRERNLSVIKNKLEELKSWRFQPRLCHGNLALNNTIVDENGKVKAVLDWGNAVSHRAPHFEFATTFFWISPEEQKAFLKGYGLDWKAYKTIRRDVERLQLLEHLGSAIWYIHRKDYKRLEYTKHKLKPLIVD